MSEDDVTWVMTSSGPRKSEYFVYKYMKVYKGSRCESVEERDRGWREGGVGVDVTYVMTSSGPLKCVYLMYRYTMVYGEARCERGEWIDEGWRGVPWDDVTWVITSSGPTNMYISHIHISID